MKVIVTGAAGFIGSHLSERLVSEGVEVVGIDMFTDYYARSAKVANLSVLNTLPGFRLVEADLRADELDSHLEGADLIVHLAAQPGVRDSWGRGFEVYVGHNVLATQRVLDAAVRTGIERVVYASSSSIYGAAESLPTAEDVTPLPISPYGVTKLTGESLLGAYRPLGISSASLRFFTVYGPRQRPDLAIHKFARKLDSGQILPIYGDGTSSRDYTYVDDIVDGVVRALGWTAGSDPKYDIFNLGESRPVELRRLVKVLEQTMGVTVKREQLPMQAGDVERTFADLTKSSAVLGYRPTTEIETGIARFVSWFREQHGTDEQCSEGDIK